MLILSLALAVLGGDDPDGPVVTAPATPTALHDAPAPATPAVGAASQDQIAHGLTTGEQIDRWIAARAPEAEPFADSAEGPEAPRRVRGYVEGGIGTGGYRSAGGGVSLPIGEEGRLDLHYRQVESDRPYYHGPYDGFAHDRFGAARADRWARESNSLGVRFRSDEGGPGQP